MEWGCLGRGMLFEGNAGSGGGASQARHRVPGGGGGGVVGEGEGEGREIWHAETQWGLGVWIWMRVWMRGSRALGSELRPRRVGSG